MAYNSTDNQYLVVWEGTDDSLPADDKPEIFGQRLDAATGAAIDDDFQISEMVIDMFTGGEAHDPAVAYNPKNNEYLVVWQGDTSNAPSL